MAAGFEYLMQAFQLIIQALIWTAVLVVFFQKKGYEKIYFLIVVAGYLLISYYLQNFYLATTFLCLWFILTGTKFFVSKPVLFSLFIALLFLEPDRENPFYPLLAGR